MSGRPAVLVLSVGGLETARRIQRAIGGVEILGLAGRVDGHVDRVFDEMTAAVRGLFAEGRPVIGLCAAGILIRMVAPFLGEKRVEPPLLAVSEDGHVVVPLVGGLTGANELAQLIAAALGTVPSITGSGARKFGIILEAPPDGWSIANPAASKGVTAALLAGGSVRIEGALPWVEASDLPLSPGATIVLKSSPYAEAPPDKGLLFHPRSAVVALDQRDGAVELAAVLKASCLAAPSIAAIIVPEGAPAGAIDGIRHSVRIVEARGSLAQCALAAAGQGATVVGQGAGWAAAVAPLPLNPSSIGRKRGRLAVAGLGPGGTDWLTPEVRLALEGAEDLFGYSTYLDMVPVRTTAARHASDNREEVARARAALDRAAEGRDVVLVSSGDPGIFAMAAAVMEALEEPAPGWDSVAISIFPGVTAAQGTAARIGAPLGHDFVVLSLSDNLKPWSVIERRLEAAGAADLVVALYNPISKARPEQFGRAIEILRRHRGGATPVILGRDVGRPGESIRTTMLGSLDRAEVDMRTVVIVGSSRTRIVDHAGRSFVYTPRTYPAD